MGDGRVPWVLSAHRKEDAAIIVADRNHEPRSKLPQKALHWQNWAQDRPGFLIPKQLDGDWGVSR
jgi:hypothetical protein